MLFSFTAIRRLFFTFSFCFFHLMHLKYAVLRSNVLKTGKSVKIQNLLVWHRNEHVIKLEVTNTWHVSVLASEKDVLGEKEMLGRETREGRVRSLWRSGDTPKVVQGSLWGHQQNRKLRLSEDMEATVYWQKQSAGAWEGAVETNDVSIASLWHLKWEQELEARIEMRPFEAVTSQWTLSIIIGDCSKVVS